MSRKFNLSQNPFGDCKIYKNSEITIEPGVTVLVGCNGVGKTTLLRLLKDSLKKENIPYVSFDNRIEGGGHAMSKAAFVEDFDLVANLATASEGEQIMINLGEKAASIGRFVISHKELDEIWVFMDAVDSGFSIDNVVDLKEYLFNTILSDCKVRGKTVYIVCTANSYEMCNGENCFDVTESKYIRFDNYDEYKRFIVLNKEKKNKRKYIPIKRGNLSIKRGGKQNE